MHKKESQICILAEGGELIERSLLETARCEFPPYYPLFLCAVRTGMRLGELFGLQWGDIDFEGRFIEVRRTVSAEQGHNAVTHELVDGALVVVDGLDHPIEDRVEELARFLWVAVGEQFHETLEVGEQDGHLLALPFQRRLGDEDLFGEVRGRVRVG